MSAADHSQVDDINQVDCLIKGHLVKHSLRLEGHRPVAAISEPVIEDVAETANVDSALVERRLRTICEQIGSKDGVPTFQMKVDS